MQSISPTPNPLPRADLAPIEQLRQRALIAIAGAVAMIIIAVGLGILLLQEVSPIFLLPFVIVAIGLVIYASMQWTRYRQTFKREVITMLVKSINPSLMYDPKGSISYNEYMQSQIYLHDVDRFEGEDFVSGTIGATPFRFSELHSEYVTTSTDKDGHTHRNWHTIFQGIFFIADFNKHFNGTTVVLPDSAEKLFGRIGQKFQELSGKLTFKRGDLVKLEDPEFERHFVVYGSDQIEARYILSTSLMQRIVDFRQRSGRRVALSFVNSVINVAIEDSRNKFEPPLFGSLLKGDYINEYLADLRFVLGIVDDLNLNLRIWSKS